MLDIANIKVRVYTERHLSFRQWKLTGNIKVKLSFCFTKRHALGEWGIAPRILWPGD